MNRTYTFGYTVDMHLLQRAMTSWEKPHRSPWQRIRALLVYVAVGGVFGAVLALSGVWAHIPDGAITGALLGFYAGLALWYLYYRRSMARLSSYAMAYLERVGKTHITASPDGVVMRTDLGSAKSSWVAYDEVIRLKDATVLRAGAVVYPVPHATLPQGVTPDQFHDDVARWWQEAFA